jgi:ABC-2 type transport system permease protein
MSSEIAIRTHGLTKNYGKKSALRGIELEVRQGEMDALIKGPGGLPGDRLRDRATVVRRSVPGILRRVRYGGNHVHRLQIRLGGGADFLSPAGFLDFSLFSYLPVVAGIFAVLLGSGLLAADEEKGVLDLILAHPISRSDLFWGRFIAFADAAALILGLTWLGYVSGLPMVDWEANTWDLLLPHLALLALLLLYGALALFMSMLLPSRSLAASLSGALMVASYLVNSLASIFAQLEPLDKILPMRYYQGGWALNGLEWGNLLILVSLTLLLALLAWLLFLRRDIRVSGEGSWRLP